MTPDELAETDHWQVEAHIPKPEGEAVMLFGVTAHGPDAAEALAVEVLDAAHLEVGDAEVTPTSRPKERPGRRFARRGRTS